MRLPARIAALLALIVVAITCADAPTAPRRSGDGAVALNGTRLALVPSFTPSATRAFASLAQFALDVTNVRITLVDADGRTVKDTVIQFPAGQDQISVELPVAITGAEQTFGATLQLRDAANQVLFSGTQQVVARTGSAPSAPPPPVTINYVGPGVSVRSVRLTPADASVGASSSSAVAASGLDSLGAVVGNTPFSFSVNDATLATLSTSGSSATVTGTGRRGTVTITAVTPTGVSGTARVSFVPQASALVAVSGGGQTVQAGRAAPAPFVVEVRATDGLPLQGVAVGFSALGTGSVGSGSAVTDASGRAGTTITAGRTAGSYAFTASAAGLTPVTATLTATAAPATALALVSGSGQADSAGRTLALPLVVRATDEFGQPVAGANVGWSVASGTGRLASASSTTGADGTASNAYTLGGRPGAESVTATLAGASVGATFGFTVRALGPSRIEVVSGGGQSAAVGGQLAPVTVRVSDSLGNAVPDVQVAWSVSNGGSASPAGSTTDAAGLASTTPRLGGTLGAVAITATAAGRSAAIGATATVGAAARTFKIAGDAQSAAAGARVATAPVFAVQDTFGNPIFPGAVRFIVASGGGSITAEGSTAAATTVAVPLDENGRARLGSWTLGAAAGENTVRAEFGTLSQLYTATATSGAPGRFLVIQPPPATITVGAALGIVARVQLTDTLGNPVRTAGVIVTATGVIQGSALPPLVVTAPTDAQGVASISIPSYTGAVGTGTITLTSPGVTTLALPAITFVAGAPAKLEAVSGSGRATVGASVTLRARVSDAGGNSLAGHSLAWAVTSGGGTVTPGASTTGADGIAQTTWMVGGAVGVQTATASMPGVPGSPATFTDTVSAGTVAALAITTQPSSSAVNGVALQTQPVVQLANGVTSVAQGGVVVTAALTSASSPNVVRSATATTDATGKATFSGLNLFASKGSWTLTFSATGYSSVTSGAITLAAGAPALMVIDRNPPASAPAGSSVSPLPRVMVTDSSGSRVGSYPVTFTVTGGGGTLQGGATLTDTLGLAVPGSWTLGTVAGSNTIAATTSPSISGTPMIFTVTGTTGSASKLLVVLAPPSQITVGVAPATSYQVRLADANGNPVAQSGVTVSGTGVVSPSNVSQTFSAVTDANGVATFSLPAYAGPTGTLVITVSAPGVTALSSSPITIVHGAAAALKFAQQPSAAAAGASISPAIQLSVIDVGGNTVVSTPNTNTATLTIASGTAGASLSGGGPVAFSSGVATFPAAALNLAGTYTLTATPSAGVPVGTATSNSFAISATSSPQLRVTTQPVASYTNRVPSTGSVVVQLRDPTGLVDVAQSGVVVTGTLSAATATSTLGSSGAVTATTDALGKATFDLLTISGTVQSGLTLTFTATGYLAVGSTSFALTPGTANALAIVTQPSSTAASGAVLAQQPVIRVVDQDQNTVTSATGTMSVSATGFTPSAPSTPITSGVATFSGLSLSGPANATSLTFTDGARSIISNSITVGAGAAASISVASGNSQSAVAGSSVTTPLQVKVADNSGTGVAGVAVTFAVASGGGTVASTSVTTNASGFASTAWTLGTTAGVNTVTASAAGLTGSPLTFSATGTAGAATQLLYVQQPSATAASGSALGTQPIIKVADANNNGVAGVAVTAGFTGATVTLSGTTVVTSNASGNATFTNLALTGTTGAAPRLQFTTSAPALTSANSNPITLTAGTASTLVVDSTRLYGMLPAGSSSVSSPPRFYVRDGAGNVPSNAAGSTVSFILLTGTNTCSLTSSTANADGTGAVSAPITLGSGSAKGCVVEASATFTTKKDTAFLAAYPAGTTNVWFGDCCTNWSNALNWRSVSNSSANVPTSNDTTKVFIPNWGTLASALAVDVIPQINRMSVDTNATVNLNGGGMIVGSGGVTGYGSFSSGYVKLYATSPASGSFDALWVGDTGSPSNFCPAAVGKLTATVTSSSATSIRAYCPTVLGGSVSTGTMTVFANGGAVIKPSGSNLFVTGAALFDGDSLVGGLGTLSVTGAATLGGKKVSLLKSTVTLSSTATFAAASASYDTTAMTVTGNATFGGTGAGIQKLSGGTLTLLGDLSQVAGDTTGKTFFTDTLHTTTFNSSEPKTINFENPTSSGFGKIVISGADATLTSSVNVGSGSTVNVDRLTVNTSAKLTLAGTSTTVGVSGNVKLNGTGTLTVNTGNNLTYAGGCSSASGSGATNTNGVRGSGLVNGQVITGSTCP